ncbi:hypothetical protein O1611_g2176 [Lasiodiplodia mahajangana]|uniref:Uncharacterized protein n=1 Tax=Lasiodiplodia mahajangana TaxID=1108764 RepID=A0ACC2JVA1_9PEZI|nr:hypothetical protein O1611_g2176 [Lasiodiplodia mahajangana]
MAGSIIKTAKAFTGRFRKGRSSQRSGLGVASVSSSHSPTDLANRDSTGVLVGPDSFPDSRNPRSPSDGAEGHDPIQIASPVLLTTPAPEINEAETLGSTKPTNEIPSDNDESSLTENSAIAPTLSLSSEDHVASLWKTAYSNLQKESPHLMYSYERVISNFAVGGSQALRISHHPLDASLSRDFAAQTDHKQRQTLMDNYLENFLGELSHSVDDNIESDGGFSEGLDPEKRGEKGEIDEDETGALRDKLRMAVRRSRYASFAWVASCLTLEVGLTPRIHSLFPTHLFFRCLVPLCSPDFTLQSLIHTSILPRSTKLEAISVLAKMEWYIGLAKLLFQAGHHDTDNPFSANGRALLVGTLVHLYEAILSYHINIVYCQWFTRDFAINVDFEKYENDIRTREEALMNLDGNGLKALLSRLILDDNVELSKDNGSVLDGSAEEPQESDYPQLEALLGRLNVIEQPELKFDTNTSPEIDILYRWVCSTPQFHDFVTRPSLLPNRVLWLKGSHGAGKTKVLKAALHGLFGVEQSLTGPAHVAYYFCGSGKTWQENALSAIKSLIAQVLKKQPFLQTYLSRKFETTSREEFNYPSDFYAMTTLLYSLLADEKFQRTYFIVGDVGELIAGENFESDNLPRSEDGQRPRRSLRKPEHDDFLTLIFTTIQVSSKIQWLVSLSSGKSDTVPGFTEGWLDLTVSSEVPEIREAASKYATWQIAEIAEQASHKSYLFDKVSQRIKTAPSNFLWLTIALNAIKASAAPWNAPEVIYELGSRTPSIDSIYDKSRKDIDKFREKGRGYYTDALSVAALAYRPLLGTELAAIIDLPQEVDLSILVNRMLMPFLEFYEDEGQRIRFAHSSARDFIRQGFGDQGFAEKLSELTKQCLKALLRSFGRACSAHPVDGPVNPWDPRDYATTFWIRHLSEMDYRDKDLERMAIHVLRDHLVQWLEILDSRNLILEATGMLRKFGFEMTTKASSFPKFYLRVQNKDEFEFHQIILNACRFLTAHQRWKDISGPIDDGRGGALSPKNSLLFSSHHNNINEELLPKYFPWLAAIPRIEPSSTDFGGSLRLMDHPDYMRECAFSPDGKLVASACDDLRVRLWDVETGKLQHVLEGFNDYVYSVVISRSGPDGHALLVSSESNAIRIWDLRTGKLIKVLCEANAVEPVIHTEKTEANIMGVGENKDQHIKMSKIDTVEGTEMIGNSESFERKEEDGEETVPFNIQSISITQDGSRLAAAIGNRVVVWDIPSYNATFWHDEMGSTYLSCVHFSRKGDILASSAGTEITIWNTETGKVIRRLPERGPVLGENRDNALVYESPRVEVDIGGHTEEPHGLAGHDDDIRGLDFSPDANLLASGSVDCTARIWDVRKGVTLEVLHHESYVNSVSFSADGNYLATAARDRNVGIWKRRISGGWGRGKTLKKPDQVLQGCRRGSPVMSVAFAPKANLLASASAGGDLRIWDIETSTTGIVADKTSHHRHDFGWSLARHTKRVKCVSISPCGKTIASASSDGVICLWDGMDGTWKYEMEAKHGGAVTALTFSPNGELLVSTSRDSNAFVWGVKDGPAGLRQCLRHTDWVRAVAISPNGRLVATGSDDETVRVWDISAIAMRGAGKDKSTEGSVPFRILSGHNGWVFTVVFSPDGHRLAAAGNGGNVMIWNLDQEGDKLAPEKHLTDTRLARGHIQGLVFSPDGERVLSVGRMVDNKGTVAVWSPATHEGMSCILQLKDTRTFTSMQIKNGNPDFLLNEYGACMFKLGEALERTGAETLRPQSHDAPPSLGASGH